MQFTRLYLIRHGQSVWNRERKVQGQTNSPLTELGQKQAEAVADLSATRKVDALYASDLTRAHETGNAIGRKVNLQPKLDPRLREMSYGILEGLTWDEAEKQHPGMYAALRGGPPDKVIPEGESRLQLVARGRDFLASVVHHHEGQDVVAATHGGLIAYVLRSLLNIPLDAPPAFRTPNCALTSFVFDKGWRLETWSQVDHLAGLSPRA